MTTGEKINVEKAIDILRSGGNLGANTISDLETSKVKAMDALILAENGFVVPSGNIVYQDSDIQYDPDFDDVDWREPVSFHQLKNRTEESQAVEELVVTVQIKNEGIRAWIHANRTKIDLVVGKLLEDLYRTEKLLKR